MKFLLYNILKMFKIISGTVFLIGGKQMLTLPYKSGTKYDFERFRQARLPVEVKQWQQQ